MSEVDLPGWIGEDGAVVNFVRLALTTQDTRSRSNNGATAAEPKFFAKAM
jgi:hypothetical protein